jgi:hypothetical protein
MTPHIKVIYAQYLAKDKDRIYPFYRMVSWDAIGLAVETIRRHMTR